MTSILLALLPDEALPLIIAGVALLLIAGLLKPRRALALVAGVVAWIVVAPFLNVLLALLPWWALLPLCLALVMTLLRALASAFFGDAATDHLVGELAADVVRGVFRLLVLPVRVLLARRR